MTTARVITSTGRVGLTQWSADTDQPINRTQMTADFGKIEQLVAIAIKGTLAARPAAGVRERLYLVDDGPGKGSLYWDTSTAWVLISAPKVLRQSHTFSVPGELEAGMVLPGFYIAAPASSQTAKIAAVRYRIGAGTSATVRLVSNRTTDTTSGALVDLPGVGSQVVPIAALFLDPADVTVPNDTFVEGYVTAVSGTPRNLTVSIYVDYTI